MFSITSKTRIIGNSIQVLPMFTKSEKSQCLTLWFSMAGSVKAHPQCIMILIFQVIIHQRK